MNYPLISVIVPVYNVEKYLERCIESIVNQTYKNLEIILVDDGSPDNCPEICDKWATRDSRIKVIHKENGGVSSARNVGINYSNGYYIGFVDSDDFLDTDMYNSLINASMNNDSDISICGYYFDEYNKNIEFGSYSLIGEDIVSDFFERQMYSVFNKLYVSSIIKENDITFNDNLAVAEDMDFVFKTFYFAKKITCIDCTLYNYMNNENSVMHRVNTNVLLCWKVIISIIDNNELTDKQSRSAYFALTKDIVYYFKALFNNCSLPEINKYYYEFYNVIINYRNYMINTDINKYNKLLIKCIARFPRETKILYYFYRRLRMLIHEK